jgi:hypothetical protein
MFKPLSLVSKSTIKKCWYVTILVFQIICIPYIVTVLYTLYWCDHFPYPYGFAILYGSTEINVIWYDNSMAERLTRSDSEGISRVQWMELMVICCGMALKGMDIWGVSVRKWRHWLWRWRQWHWLVKVDTVWHALFVKCTN